MRQRSFVSFLPAMLLFKRLLTSCILFLVLLLVILIIIGTAIGIHGGIGSAPALRDYDSSFGAGHRFGYDIARQYGYVVFLSTISFSALAALVISFSGILPWCRKRPDASTPTKV
jgi:hypothetical protein